MDDSTRSRHRTLFQHYADSAFPASGAHIYAAITRDIVGSDAILALCAETLPRQPAPNLLFGAVHQLLQSGVQHPLASYYPDLTDNALPASEAGPPFADFCATHGDAIARIVRSRRVQTNVLERCGVLLPGFAAAAAWHGSTALAVVEVGASAGLNLLWDRYCYSYDDGSAWGDPASPVEIAVELRGTTLPELPPELRAAWSAGVDLEPVDCSDPEDVAWQRALIWPERIDRARRMDTAIRLAGATHSRVVRGDAVVELPSLLDDAPADLVLVIVASFTPYQFPRAARAALLGVIELAAATREIVLLVFDGDQDAPANDAILAMTTYGRGSSETTTLARAHPHGTWLDWAPDARAYADASR